MTTADDFNDFEFVRRDDLISSQTIESISRAFTMPTELYKAMYGGFGMTLTELSSIGLPSMDEFKTEYEKFRRFGQMIAQREDEDEDLESYSLIGDHDWDDRPMPVLRSETVFVTVIRQNAECVKRDASRRHAQVEVDDDMIWPGVPVYRVKSHPPLFTESQRALYGYVVHDNKTDEVFFVEDDGLYVIQTTRYYDESDEFVSEQAVNSWIGGEIDALLVKRRDSMKRLNNTVLTIDMRFR